MHFGALGDIHGDFVSARRIIERHREVPFWLCIGDVADEAGRYEDLPAPVYWIKGNNENFDLIAEWQGAWPGIAPSAPPHLHYIPNGRTQEIPGTPTLRVAGLGGTFAPTMYEVAAADLPHPKKGSAKATELADRRRHFVREEVEACRAMRDIDVLLTHEAPRPFRPSARAQGAPSGVEGRSPRGNDAGKTQINEVLASMKPRLHLFGHHHRFAESVVSGVRSVCLDLVSASFLLVDATTLEYQRVAS